MENEHIAKSEQKLIVGLGFRLDTLRHLRKRAKNSSDQKELKDTIVMVSETLVALLGKHVGINKDNDIVFVRPIDTKKIAKVVNKGLSNQLEEKAKTR